MAQRRSHSQANQLNNRMNHQYKNMRPNQRASFRQQESFRQLNELLLQPRTPRSDAYSHPLEANSPYGPPFPGSSTPRNLPTQPNLQNDWLFMHPTHPVYPSIDFLFSESQANPLGPESQSSPPSRAISSSNYLYDNFCHSFSPSQVTELVKPLVFTNANLTNLTQTPC
ncbi:hypothetical protein PtA15_12A534 [Puccinia triticina]|uniref:Uncharacterized protein n=1 Tax=Puccinia triticina TaxID=208348 RepID=A0ABY7CYY5_9BASI|nr:uncharacterized protein PtA15_12A534 [Puccinia triticina]WAQ90544.1 hypothetical protein PtA15_12A534 [Puccinia triticina]WAR61859.1 hypothetical protein PtB15_12B551 [Puccinia triticina]